MGRQHPIYWISLFLCTLLSQWQGGLAVQCFKCVYVPFASGSDATCSDPWPWYRQVFGKSTLPPVYDCPHSCMKVVIGNKAHSPSVVRTCSEHCEEGTTLSTITTCCHDDLCNAAHSLHTPTTVQALVTLTGAVIWMVAWFGL